MQIRHLTRLTDAQQEIGEVRSGDGAVLRLLQLLPRSRHEQDDASAAVGADDGDLDVGTIA